MKSLLKKLPWFFSVTFLFVFFFARSISAQTIVSAVEAEAIADLWHARKIESSTNLSALEKAEKIDRLSDKTTYYLISADTLLDMATADHPYVYVFDYADGGFVFIAGDESLPPVLGYSTDIDFTWYDSEYNFNRLYLAGVVTESRNGTRMGRSAEEVANSWDNIKSLLASSPDLHQLGSLEDPERGMESRQVNVDRVLWRTPTWWQYDPYHDEVINQCPNWADPVNPLNDEWRVSTGCNAVAMSMIMRFHEWPPNSIPIPDWLGPNNPPVGEEYDPVNGGPTGPLCNMRNAGNHNYNYTQMPWDDVDINDPTVDDTSPQIAQLMYDAAVSIQSDFVDYHGVSVHDHTFASHSLCTGAMNDFFNYRLADQADFKTANGLDELYESIVGGLPVFVHVSGHNVVASGYEDDPVNGIMVYINWGHADPFTDAIAAPNHSGWYIVGAGDPMIHGNPFQSPENYIYVDQASTATTDLGNIDAAYDNITDGYNATPGDGDLWIKAGNYTSDYPSTFSREMSIRSYDGQVNIDDRVKINTTAEWQGPNDVAAIHIRDDGQRLIIN